MASKRTTSFVARAVSSYSAQFQQGGRLHTARSARWHAPPQLVSARANFIPLQRSTRRCISDDSELKSSSIYDFAKVKELATSPPSADPKPLLIDVREPHEFAGGYIPSAINLPIQSQPDALFLNAEEFEDRFGMKKPVQGQELVFYCKAGVRSRAAAQLARQVGYAKVGEYPGSWMDWVGKGGEVSGGQS